MVGFDKRLKQIMDIQGIRAVDVVRKSEWLAKQENSDVTITKQNMSNYLSGRSEPTTDKLHLLSKALHVEPNYFTCTSVLPYAEDKLSKTELSLIQHYRLASQKDKEMIAFILADYGFVYDDSEKGD